MEFCRLKRLVPAVSSAKSVSKLDVILEAIRYIDQLQAELARRAEAMPAEAAAAMLQQVPGSVDKENSNGAHFVRQLESMSRRRKRSKVKRIGKQ